MASHVIPVFVGGSFPAPTEPHDARDYRRVALGWTGNAPRLNQYDNWA